MVARDLWLRTKGPMAGWSRARLYRALTKPENLGFEGREVQEKSSALGRSRDGAWIHGSLLHIHLQAAHIAYSGM